MPRWSFLLCWYGTTCLCSSENTPKSIYLTSRSQVITTLGTPKHISRPHFIFFLASSGGRNYIAGVQNYLYHHRSLIPIKGHLPLSLIQPARGQRLHVVGGGCVLSPILLHPSPSMPGPKLHVPGCFEDDSAQGKQRSPIISYRIFHSSKTARCIIHVKLMSDELGLGLKLHKIPCGCKVRIARLSITKPLRQAV